MNSDSIDDILDFAINAEQKAATFYDKLAQRMKGQKVSQVFSDFALEERLHKSKLEELKASKQLHTAVDKITDIIVGDYQLDEDLSTDLLFRHALLLALKSEKLAFTFYTQLAERTDDPAKKHLLQTLAQEEAKHKLRFE
ncbi:MAG: ferritin family protein, partial [candidate division Zixibacteria bacterium]